MTLDLNGSFLFDPDTFPAPLSDTGDSFYVAANGASDPNFISGSVTWGLGTFSPAGAASFDAFTAQDASGDDLDQFSMEDSHWDLFNTHLQSLQLSLFGVDLLGVGGGNASRNSLPDPASQFVGSGHFSDIDGVGSDEQNGFEALFGITSFSVWLAAVPEPDSLALFAAGVFALLAINHRRKRATTARAA